jgi:hypothetical protein
MVNLFAVCGPVPGNIISYPLAVEQSQLWSNGVIQGRRLLWSEVEVAQNVDIVGGCGIAVLYVIQQLV